MTEPQPGAGASRSFVGESPTSVSIAIGPLRDGGGKALIVDAAVPGVGNVIEQLADSVEVTSGGPEPGEFLNVRLAYSNGGT